MEKPDVLKLLERPLSERDVKTINDAIQQARQDTARELIEEIENGLDEYFEATYFGNVAVTEDWQSFKSKFLIPPNPVGSADV